jgi:hypothetical protein
MRIVKASKSFSDSIGIRPLIGKRLDDIVVPADHEKVARLHRELEDIRLQKQSNYLPPIYNKADDERSIQAVGLGPADVSYIRMEKIQSLAFQTYPGEQKHVEAAFGLSKRDTVDFIVMKIISPNRSSFTTSRHLDTTSYSGESNLSPHSPPSNYGQQLPLLPQQYQSLYEDNRNTGQAESLLQQHTIPPQLVDYTTPARLRSDTVPNIPPYSQQPYYQTSPTSDNQHQQYLPQIPRSAPAQFAQPPQNYTSTFTPTPTGKQSELQLPPLINTSQAGPSDPPNFVRPGDMTRSNRLHIGGLLESPKSHGEGR